MIQLIDPELGTLELRDAPFAVASFQIGSPASRDVSRPRALADGSYDDTRFVGGRAVTVAVRLNESYCAPVVTIQALYDQLLPFMSARRRPIIRWSLPGTGEEREMVVRGDNAPVIITGAKHPAVVLQFVSADGEITSAPYLSQTIDPAADTELGRAYDLTFDRSYPASAPVGSRSVTQVGNQEAHWKAQLFGPVTNPFLKINNSQINFNANGGLVVAAGSYVEISTRERTINLNSVLTDSVYDRTNFAAWSWSDLLLKPGANQVRFGPTGVAVVTWRSTWAG